MIEKAQGDFYHKVLMLIIQRGKLNSKLNGKGAFLMVRPTLYISHAQVSLFNSLICFGCFGFFF